MQQPQSSSISAHVAAAFTVFLVFASGDISVAKALSPPGSPLLAPCSSSASIATQFRASRQLYVPQSSSNDRRSLCVLYSSLKDPSETDAFDVEKFEDSLDDLHALPGDVPKCSVEDTIQLQDLLSSPKLLDPTSILNVTIGINDDNEVTVHTLTNNDAGFTSTACTSDLAIETCEQENQVRLDCVAVTKEEDVINNGPVVESTIEHSQDKNLIASVQPASKKSALENVPSIRKILRYTIPAIGIWLCSPVLSMIDTASVGLLSGTVQQASLNPAVSISDYGALIVAFMYTATTNLIAAAVQKDKDALSETSSSKDAAYASISEQQPRTTKTLLTALQLALVVGTVFGALLGVSGKLLLKMLVGNNSLDPAVFGAALRYVHIRALGMPAMVVIGTAQSACLGMQDVKSPLYVLATAAAVNLLGDILLVPRTSSFFGGAAGAAWATVASQYAAMLFFSKWFTTNANKDDIGNSVRRKSHGGSDDPSRTVNVTRGIMELTGTSKEGKSRRKYFHKLLASSRLSRRVHHHSPLSVSQATAITEPEGVKPKKQQPKTRGFLSEDKVTKQNYLSLANIKPFLPFVVPVTTTSIGRISGYIAMAHVASSILGPYSMAAQQIILAIFCCLAPLVDALSQVAQSFFPAVYEVKEKSQERAMALQRTTNNFRKVGAAFGALLVALVSCIPLISGFFTTDSAVLKQVNGAIPGVALFLSVNGLMCAGEGALLGQKDLKFLRNMYAIFFFAVPSLMLRLKHRSLAGVQAVGVGSMWAVFSIYNVVRTIIWHLRLTQLQQRTEKEVACRNIGKRKN